MCPSAQFFTDFHACIFLHPVQELLYTHVLPYLTQPFDIQYCKLLNLSFRQVRPESFFTLHHIQHIQFSVMANQLLYPFFPDTEKRACILCVFIRHNPVMIFHQLVHNPCKPDFNQHFDLRGMYVPFQIVNRIYVACYLLVLFHCAVLQKSSLHIGIGLRHDHPCFYIDIGIAV